MQCDEHKFCTKTGPIRTKQSKSIRNSNLESTVRSQVSKRFNEHLEHNLFVISHLSDSIEISGVQKMN